MKLLRTSLVLALGLTLTTSMACKKKPAETAPATVPVAAEPKPKGEVPAEVTEMAANFSRVYFAFDKHDLADPAREALDANVTIMNKKTDIKVEIQGHADERGTTDYNLALGTRRAQSVYNYMTARGIAPSRLKVVSYGEEVPLQRGSTESAWSKNRRAEFRITWGDGATGTTN